MLMAEEEVVMAEEEAVAQAALGALVPAEE